MSDIISFAVSAQGNLHEDQCSLFLSVSQLLLCVSLKKGGSYILMIENGATFVRPLINK